jgi:ABC-type branched-subunit amino acid transport system ATPase component
VEDPHHKFHGPRDNLLDAGYDGQPVVRDIALRVDRGEVVALLGPNGAGKTTTLNTIAGLIPSISGEILFEGAPITGTPTHKLAARGLALVPEGRALFFGLTVDEHIRLAATKDGLGRDELLDLLPELRKRTNAKAGFLSGGEQQMLAVGRALVSRPRLLLVDEMSLGLAPIIVEDAAAATGVQIADIAYFDDMLHEDPTIRRKKHDFMLAVMDTAVYLGVPAVCGFVGRNQSKSMEENLVDFEESFIPLLQAAKDKGLQYRVEQCPMPGWTPGDNFHNNIAYTPGTWIALHQICERHGLGDQFRIHYDPSHAILMGQDTRSLFQYLNDEGYAFLIGGMHVKGQVIDGKGLAGWGYGGQTIQRGDWIDGAISPNPADLANAWKVQTVLCEHELPGTARHDPLAYLQNRTVDWLDHQLAARELLDIDFATTPLIVEHEYPAARVQDKGLLKPILEGSVSFTRNIDRAAADMFSLQQEVLASQGIPVQGIGRIAYRS